MALNIIWHKKYHLDTKRHAGEAFETQRVLQTSNAICCVFTAWSGTLSEVGPSCSFDFLKCIKEREWAKASFLADLLGESSAVSSWTHNSGISSSHLGSLPYLVRFRCPASHGRRVPAKGLGRCHREIFIEETRGYIRMPSTFKKYITHCLKFS